MIEQAASNQPDPHSTPNRMSGSGIHLCFKAAGDPLRIEVLRVLRNNSYGVLELCEIFAIRQPAMSHHLKVLAAAGLVTTQREGNAIFYRRPLLDTTRQDNLARQLMFQAIDLAPPAAEYQPAVTRLRDKRADTAREFFVRHADRFQAQQELIATYDQYAILVKDMLSLKPSDPSATAMEVGPGEGHFLLELSPLFQQVTALDISPALLNRAKALTRESGLCNIAFLLGETTDALSRGIQVDTLIFNMVLHHLPHPASAFQDANKLLKPGGRLIVTDLCHHQQNWAREKCGDLWLGFDPNDLDCWAAAAGLVQGESIFRGLRNGFQVQVREYLRTDNPLTAHTQHLNHEKPQINQENPQKDVNP